MKLFIQICLAGWIATLMVTGIWNISSIPFDELTSADLIFLLVCSSICFSVTVAGKHNPEHLEEHRG